MTDYAEDDAFLESWEPSPEDSEGDGAGSDAGAVEVLSGPSREDIPLPPQVWPEPPNDPLARPVRRAVRMSAGKSAPR